MAKLGVTAEAKALWSQKTEQQDTRFREGFRKFREALEQDAREAAERGSGLPKDWRNRVFK